MKPVGSGVVTIGRLDEDYLLSVRDPRGRSYRARIFKDLSQCVFLDRNKLNSEEDFSRKSGGALGRRIDRVWSSDRFMVLVGITEKDAMHFIYFRDRATNDPLLIAKFEPYKTDEPPPAVAPPARQP